MKNVKAAARDWRALQQTLVATSFAKDHLLLMLANVTGVAAAPSRTASALQQQRQPPKPRASAAMDPFLLTQFVADASAPGLALLQSTLARIVDWDASKGRGTLAVQPGVDATLDEYRRTYEGTCAE